MNGGEFEFVGCFYVKRDHLHVVEAGRLVEFGDLMGLEFRVREVIPVELE